ncbi:MAG: ATP-binding domain-containing protein [Hydrogenophaga sp.]|jgi:DNA polymerase III delta prime subunit|uniref:ATP-binding domain-containing protein n=1 Tax=Hydrogenophaga sp. TaxID=1904254 RepID=UPI001D9AA2AD|nr:ATP-binding domain-containing protein [Hydrogenophaga sp.]MBW0172132.1 ATP-binding domain-containing protein [Hydrogenophaga sp.]MBW0186181.1 ATP-binding domain-containing protein [Hydrogenophaga sp.]
MTLKDGQRLEPLATEIVGKLDAVASTAKSWLASPNRLGVDSLANAGNTLNSDRAARALDNVNQANEAAFRKLASEPSIARVVAEDKDGHLTTYYFCRAEQGMVTQGLFSYRAPIGRLAALPVGDEYVRPDGKALHVIERAQLRPTPLAGAWDAYTVVQSEDAPTVTIESLRKLLERHPELIAPVEDLVALLLASAEASQNVIEGMKRSVITKMGLRDQPVLDQFQDEIFRLPLNRRVLLLGPPGTGKTTTLIRRLGQKLDVQFLDEDEQRVAEELAQSQQMPHGKSWVMFTPTELLKQYLKEAFSREGVPAPDQNIRTWGDHRRDLARQTFGVLRTASGGGTFVLKPAMPGLQPSTEAQPITWFEDFQAWQGNAYREELIEAVKGLVGASLPAAHQLGKRLQAPLQEAVTWPATFAALAGELPAVQTFVGGLKEETDTAIKAALNAQLARNKGLISDLSKFIESLQQQASAEGDLDDDQDGDDDDEVVIAPRVGAAAAINAYMQAVRTQARNASAKRSTNKTTRSGKIIEWLGDRTLPPSDLATLGASLLLQTNARRFTNPVKRYIDGIPKRYRAFRRLRQDEGQWYAKSGFEPRDLHPLELDVVLLAILRSAGDLLQRPTVMRDIENPAWASLKPALSTLRSQIVVDEATDFSPIQLACMAAMAHPRLRSFFACGDFNQRLTTWGSRSTEELQWVFADVDIRRITVTYRQSRQLNEVARDIIQCIGGSHQDAILPAEVDNEGEPPVLLEYASHDAIVRWLAARIREIDQFMDGKLPSTAIFVNSETEVETIAVALNEALAPQNIQVVACREGQAVGQESNVRVFDVQHIKGLEFEAVFFVGIDQLAVGQPELFGKFMYVGATRAAQYLGVTCTAALPSALEPLRKHFGATWDAVRTEQTDSQGQKT